MASPNTISYSVIKEVTAGTTPATPAFKRFSHVTGDNLQLESDSLTSPVMMPGGAGAGNTKTSYRVEGPLKTHLNGSDAATKSLLEAAAGGTASSGVIKCGLTDIPLTIEKTFVEGGTTYYRQFKGVRVSKFNLSCDASGTAEASFDVIGMSDARSSTMITGATYAAAATSKRFNGTDVSVSIAGVTATYSSLEFAIESEKEAQYAFGSQSAINVGTSGMRKVTLSVTLFRKDYTPETALINDTPIAVSFTIGTTGNGYTFTLPAATSATPKDEEDGSKMFVTLEFTGAYDATALTDCSITEL